MFDVALTEAGAHVNLATSHDENHPPECMIDGKPDTFWTSTGIYPQEFIISFTSLMNMSNIRVQCANVKRLLIERSVQHTPTDFEPIGEKELENGDGFLTEEFLVNNMTAEHLKFSILSGYDHFVAVQKVHVDGTAVHSQ